MKLGLWSFDWIRRAGLVISILAMPSLAAAGTIEWIEPTPGTVEWAKALNKAWGEVQQAGSGHELIDRSQNLLALYWGCGSCRQQVYSYRDNRLGQRLADKPLLQQAQEEEFADDPVSLSRLFLETGRVAAARDLAARELRRTRFLERRLELMETLAGAERQLVHLDVSQKLAKRLLEETPVSAWYCDKALHWMTWLGEDPVRDWTSIGRRDFLKVFEDIRRLEERRGNDAYVSCRMANALTQWDRYIAGMSAVNVSVDPDVFSLFPRGIDPPLEDLARRTSDPTTRAAVLLQAAQRWITHNDPPHLNGLIEEALHSGTAPNIQAGALVLKSNFLPFEQKQAREAFALHLIDRFPDSEAAFVGCYGYWAVLGYQRPDFPGRIPDWKKKCLDLFQRSPNRVEHWERLIATFTPEPECAAEVCRALQGMKPPDEVAPMILLRLSAALRRKDPAEAWALERRAIHHPQFPGLGNYLYWSFFTLAETLVRAEDHGDHETAEFLRELFERHPGPKILM